MPRMSTASQASMSEMLGIEARARIFYILLTRLFQGTDQIPQVDVYLCNHHVERLQKSWAEHKKIHRPGDHAWHYCIRRGESRALYRPEFKWTGSLRPYRIGPSREIPDSIPKTDYYRDGIPRSEIRSRQQSVGTIVFIHACVLSLID